MAKGKYAVKAANTRAENVADKLQRLEALLAKERAEHAAETTALKNQVQQLAGRLTREVGALADASINQARTEARELVAAERAQQQAKALEAYRLLLSTNPQFSPEDSMRLCELFGIPVGEGIAHYDIPRGARRMTGSKMRHALEKFEQGATAAFNVQPESR
jgi:hypothetical protein